MSRLLASRDAIIAGLTAGGIRTSTTGQFSAPAVLVEPGDPWTTAAAPTPLAGKRIGRWRLTAVGGKADTARVIEVLAELVDLTDTALLTVPGVSLPAWAMPRDLLIGNVPYAASMATVQCMTEE